MNRFLLTIAVAGFASTAPAADPTFTGQIQPLDTLTAKATDAFQRLLSAEQYGPARDQIRAAFDINTLKSIDPKRPIGIYGTISDDIFTNRVVVLLPIIDEKEFVKRLKSFGLDLKEADGLTSIVVPGVDVQTFLKFADGYAYLSLLSGTPLDDKNRLAPKSVFREGETAAAVLRLRPALLPDVVKQFAQTAVAESADKLERDSEALIPAKQATRAAGTLMTRWTDMLFVQSREISLRFDLDPKTSLASAEFEIEPEPKSRLATSLAEYQPLPNALASIAPTDAPLSGRFTLPLFNDEMKELASGVLYTGQTLVKMSEDYALADFTVDLLKALNRQAKTGSIDVGGSLRGPDKDGKFTAIVGMTLRDTSSMEKSLRKAVADADQSIRDRIRFSAAKIGAVDVYELDVFAILPPGWQAVFGENKAVIVFAPQGVFVAIGPDARPRLDEALKAKPAASPIGEVQAKWDGVMKLVRTFDVNAADHLAQVANAELRDVPLVRIETTTGKSLKFKVSVSAIAVATLMGVRDSRRFP